MNRCLTSLLTLLLIISNSSFCAAVNISSGQASNASITIKSGDSCDWAYGGESYDSDVFSNKVTMTGGTVGHSLYGGQSGSYNAYSNSVTISGGKSESWTYGGHGNITYKNTVTVTGGYGGCAYGGRGQTESYENTVIVSGGETSYAYGGNVTDGYVHDNRVIIKDNGVVYNEVYGGSAWSSGVTSNNTVEIQGGTARDDVYGGHTYYGTGTGNKVIVSGGKVQGMVCGAYGMGAAGFTNNSVIVSNGVIEGFTYGAHSEHSAKGPVSGNKVEVSGGTLSGVYGGYSYGASAEYNEVTVTGGTIAWVTGGTSVNGETQYNTVTIRGGTVTGQIMGGGGNTSNHNSVNLYGGNLTDVYGSPSGSNNTVSVFADITVGSIGGQRWKNGDGNALKINGHKLTASSVIYFDDYQFVLPTSLSTAESVITITGTRDVDMSSATVSHFEDPNGILTEENHVVLIDKATGDFQETIFDGIVEMTATTISVKDNQLIAEYGWIEPEKGEQGDKGETGDKGEQGDKGESGDKGQTGDKGETGDKGDVGDPGQQGEKGEPGDKGQTGDKGPVGDKGDIGDQGEQGGKGEAGDKGPTGDKGETGDKGQTGDPGDCGCDTESKEDRLAKVASEQTKTLTYSILGQVGLINQSTDMVINTGIDRALSSLSRVGQGNMAAFFATSIGRDRYKTGSHVYVNGVSSMAGIAYAPKNADGFAVGVFGEFGHGQSDAFNSSLTGNGDNEYTGGGILSRWNDIFGSGIYLEATARMGRSKVDFVADGFLTNASGGTRSVDYDMRGSYYGAHLGIGRVIPLNDCTSLEVSAKYLWARQKGDDIIVAGESLKISDVDSHRIRAGARIRHNYNQRVSVYSGAWVESEFGGKASIIGASGKRYQGGSIRGTSGVGEVGVSFGSGRDSRWLLDLGVTGHIGRRRGITGNAGFSMSF